jgi:hypothetical protein
VDRAVIGFSGKSGSPITWTKTGTFREKAILPMKNDQKAFEDWLYRAIRHPSGIPQHSPKFGVIISGNYPDLLARLLAIR